MERSKQPPPPGSGGSGQPVRDCPGRVGAGPRNPGERRSAFMSGLARLRVGAGSRTSCFPRPADKTVSIVALRPRTDGPGVRWGGRRPTCPGAARREPPSRPPGAPGASGAQVCVVSLSLVLGEASASVRSLG